MADLGYTAELADLAPPPASSVPSYSIDINAEFDRSAVGGQVFDAVVAVEVIEHLDNPTSFLKKVRSILHSEGKFLVTTPNVLDLDSRRLMLVKGEFALFRRGSFYSTGHRSILPFWLLEEILVHEGFSILERRFIGKKDRKGFRRFLTPPINAFLLPFGRHIPWKAAFAPCVAIMCARATGQNA